MTRLIETAEALVADTQGRTIAYECAGRYPCFKGASRGALKQSFLDHGFATSAARFDTTAENALSEAVQRYSRAVIAKYSNPRSSSTLSVTEVPVEPGHARAWLVEQVEKKAGERQPVRTPGARVFLSGDDIYAAPPVDGQEIPACASVARELRDIAQWLQATADTTVVSRAMTSAYAEAGAFPWINRGSYVAAEGRPGTARLVALITELRSKYYDPGTRCGLRLSAVPIKSGEEQSVQALVDAVLDEVSTKVDKLVGKLKDESGRSNVRASTYATRRDECQEVLQIISQYRGLMGEWADRFTKIAGDAAGAYNAAVDGQSLELPEWAADYSSATSSEGEDAACPVPVPPQPAVAEAAPAAPEPAPEPAKPTEPDPFAL